MNISDLLKILKKFWILEVVIVVAVTGLATWHVKQETPIYSSSTQVLVRTQTENTDLTSVNASLYAIRNQMDTYTNLVTTESVLQPVIDDLGLKITPAQLSGSVSAKTKAGTLMSITATNSDPQTAANIANEVAKSLNDLISNNLYTDGGKLTTPIEFNVVQKAYPATAPISPNVQSEVFKGAVAGLGLAIFVALALGFMDQKIRQVADVESIVSSPVIGNLSRNTVYSGSAPAVIAQPSGSAAEEIRRIAANLMFVVPQDLKHANVIVVTSGSAAEGKSTVAVNLASAYAEKGDSVLLIDADLRKPSVDKYLGINGAAGLTHLIAGRADAQTVIQRYWKRNFHVLPAGAKTANPSLLLGSETMHRQLEQFAAQYDHVIIDTAPMDVANDAAVFAKDDVLVVLVVGENVATKKSLHGVVNEFKMINAPITATVINFAEKEKRRGKYYYYYADDKKGDDQTAGAALAEAPESEAPRVVGSGHRA